MTDEGFSAWATNPRTVALMARCESFTARLAEAERLLLGWADATDKTFGAIGGKPGVRSVETRAFLASRDRHAESGSPRRDLYAEISEGFDAMRPVPND